MKPVILSALLYMGIYHFELLPNRSIEENGISEFQQPDSSYYGSDSRKKTFFEFSNGKSICLSGWMEIEDEKEIYSEFNLRDCDTGEVLDERGALEECILSLSSDTLWVYELEHFARGEDHALVKFPWKIGAHYYGDDGFKYSEWFNENLRYDQQTIELVLKEYETTKWRTQQEDSEYVDFHLMGLANKLMIAAISGNQTSEMYFNEFRIRVKPDGYLLQWYTKMERILEYAKADN